MHAASSYQVKLGVGKMKRDGYISTTQVFKVHCSMATLYHRSIDGYRLDRPSFLVVLKHVPGMESLLEEMFSKAVIKAAPQPPQKALSPEPPISETADVEETPSLFQGIELLSLAWQGVSLFVSWGYSSAVSKLRGDVEKENEVPGLQNMG